LPGGQKVASYLATDLAGDSSNCKHLFIFSFELASPSDEEESQSDTSNCLIYIGYR
jgi:hypothetical protein